MLIPMESVRTRVPARSLRAVIAVSLTAFLVGAPPLRAQESRWDAAAEVVVSRLSSLEETAVGFGLRTSFRAHDWLALDGSVGLAPGDLGEPAFSGSLAEVLLGVRVGPRPRPLAGYVALRGGFVRYSEAPELLACIAIFPPPLACVLSTGRSPAALQAGLGLERHLGERGLVRVEAGDRLVRMPGPSFDSRSEARLEDYWSHELRLAMTVRLRF